MILNIVAPKESKEKPPNWDMLEERLGLQWGPGVIVTYGDTIYSPDHPLPEDVQTHEFVHVQQQCTFPGGPDAFVQRYLEDDDFRYKMELEAYRTQWISLKRDLPAGASKRQAVEPLVDKFLLDFNIGEILYTQKVSREQIRKDILNA